MKINELISDFTIFITNEEKQLLKKLKNPVKFVHLTDHEQCVVETMVRKSLVKKIGFKDPTIVANEKTTL